MSKLQDSYLGGSGSRGYGKIEFKDITFKIRTKDDYINGADGTVIKIDGKDKFTLPEILQPRNFERLKAELSK
jgi:CRISPR-associated protein Csm3